MGGEILFYRSRLGFDRCSFRQVVAGIDDDALAGLKATQDFNLLAKVSPEFHFAVAYLVMFVHRSDSRPAGAHGWHGSVQWLSW